jgi:hypothetical protein
MNVSTGAQEQATIAAALEHTCAATDTDSEEGKGRGIL